MSQTSCSQMAPVVLFFSDWLVHVFFISLVSKFNLFCKVPMWWQDGFLTLRPTCGLVVSTESVLISWTILSKRCQLPFMAVEVKYPCASTAPHHPSPWRTQVHCLTHIHQWMGHLFKIHLDTVNNSTTGSWVEPHCMHQWVLLINLVSM